MIRRLGIDRAGKAALIVGVCLLVSGLTAATIRVAAHPFILKAYSYRFSFLPGHWFGERVAQLSDEASSSCIIIGASNAREGFDPRIIQARTPGTEVLNAATTGGNNEVLEVQSAILEQNKIRPKCVIAGVSTWMMFRNGSPLINAEGYLGLLEWDDVLDLAGRPLLSTEGPRIAIGLTLPLRSQARQLNRVVREEIRRLRAATIGALPSSRYEAYKGELQPADDYLYLHTPSHLMKDWDKLVDENRPWYPKSRYGGSAQERSLRTTLDRLLSISQRVVFVITPQTPILDPASRSGSPYFWKVMNSYRGRVTLIDCSGFRDYDLFVDEGHLNAQGRALMSAEIGAILGTRLAGMVPASSAHCSVVQP